MVTGRVYSTRLVYREFYRPTDRDLEILKSEFPDEDPENPSWDSVEAELVAGGYVSSRLRSEKAPTLVRLLKDVKTADALRGAEPGGEGPSHVLLSWEKTKVAPQRDVIRLRQANAAPSQQSNAADAPAGAQPPGGPSQVQLTQHLAETTPTINTTPDLAEAPKSKPRAKRGRKPETDAKADKRIAEAWSSEQYPTFEALGRALKLSTREVRLAVDRHRKREKRK
ncbi:MAG: hypothetical protein JSU86_03435 [Phycisphaerales bacterium]|nr:MAG: hypothetical protein JSU86_03435 [Phycisphaerales bacterium]